MSFRSFITKLNHRHTRIFPKFSLIAKITLLALITICCTSFVVHILAATQDSDMKRTFDGMDAGGNFESWQGLDSPRVTVMGAFNIFVDRKTLNPDLISGKIPANGQYFVQAPGGIIGSVNTTIAQLYNQPVSGIEYLAEMKDSFLGKPAYAQGVGFQSLQPILPVWRAFRNVVYVLSSLVFIVIGIMIMLRVKISPQAVINLQNAIPQLVTALILVTFSYAIAGLLIDVSNLVLSLVIAILFSSQGSPLTSNLFFPGLSLSTKVPALNALVNPFSFANLANAGMPETALLLVIPSFVTALLAGIISFIIGFMITLPLSLPGMPLGLGAGVALLYGGTGFMIVLIILMVMIVIWLIKFLFGLFKCYATVIFKIVLAPLEIGMGAFPNSKIGFNTWFIDLLANLAVFPISFLFLVLSNFIIANIIWGGFSGTIADIIAGKATNAGMWTPAILGGGAIKTILSPIGGIAATAIGVSTLLLLSKLPEMIPQYIFMLKPSPWGAAIGESFSNLPGSKMVAKAGQTAAVTGKQYIHNRLREVQQDNPDSKAGKTAAFFADVGELSGNAKPNN